MNNDKDQIEQKNSTDLDLDQCDKSKVNDKNQSLSDEDLDSVSGGFGTFVDGGRYVKPGE